MKKFIKIFLLSFVLTIFIFSLAGIVFGASGNVACNEFKYPWCNAKKADLGDAVKSIYNYSLALVGVTALGVIIFGGIKYIMSAGNPSEQNDATQWITGAVWGLVLLFGAVLLFETINPQITSLKLPKLEGVKVEKATSTIPTPTGCCLYDKYDDGGGITAARGSYKACTTPVEDGGVSCTTTYHGSYVGGSSCVKETITGDRSFSSAYMLPSVDVYSCK